jgi:hypothetical protein
MSTAMPAAIAAEPGASLAAAALTAEQAVGAEHHRFHRAVFLAAALGKVDDDELAPRLVPNRAVERELERRQFYRAAPIGLEGVAADHRRGAQALQCDGAREPAVRRIVRDDGVDIAPVPGRDPIARKSFGRGAVVWARHISIHPSR